MTRCERKKAIFVFFKNFERAVYVAYGTFHPPFFLENFTCLIEELCYVTV